MKLKTSTRGDVIIILLVDKMTYYILALLTVLKTRVNFDQRTYYLLVFQASQIRHKRQLKFLHQRS